MIGSPHDSSGSVLLLLGAFDFVDGAALRNFALDRFELTLFHCVMGLEFVEAAHL